MKKDHMLTFLEKQLEKYLGEYDFAIDWDTKNHTVEVIAVLYAQNQGSEAIADLDGIETEEEVIEFEDSLLLYDPAKGEITDEDEYLATIPYEGKKGIQKKVLITLAKYLGQVLTEGESNLMDFLGNEELEVFELQWDQDEFNALLAAATGPEDYVAYPKY